MLDHDQYDVIMTLQTNDALSLFRQCSKSHHKVITFLCRFVSTVFIARIKNSDSKFKITSEIFTEAVNKPEEALAAYPYSLLKLIRSCFVSESRQLIHRYRSGTLFTTETLIVSKIDR